MALNMLPNGGLVLSVVIDPKVITFLVPACTAFAFCSIISFMLWLALFIFGSGYALFFYHR